MMYSYLFRRTMCLKSIISLKCDICLVPGQIRTIYDVYLTAYECIVNVYVALVYVKKNILSKYSKKNDGSFDEDSRNFRRFQVIFEDLR